MTIGQAAQPRICFVTGDFAGIVRNSGIGTYFLLMSRLLAHRGWDVHVLYAGDVDDEEAIRAAPETLAREGITFTWLDKQPRPASADANQYGIETVRLRLSQLVLDALEAMHAEHRFDIIEFPDWDALGFRPVQAKRMGVALQDVALAVKLHGTSQWQREGNFELRTSPMQLKVEWCERYAFENADLPMSPSHYMIDWVRGVDWQIGDDVTISYPFPSAESQSAQAVDGIRELVFFGRLESRKGLDAMLDAVVHMDLDLPVLFMGKDTRRKAAKASDWIAGVMGDRPFRIETELERDEALAELLRGGRLAIMPSVSESFGFTVAECVANRIPFIAARAGGVPEVFPHAEAQRRWLFEPHWRDLAWALQQRLAADVDEERALRDQVAKLCDPEIWNDRVAETYRSLLTRTPPRPRRARSASATITVGVSHYNKAAYLPQALRSIAEQERQANEVIIVDDGSTDPEALRVFAEQEQLYPDWTFVRQENAGPGAARNSCLKLAAGTYFLPFDADNIATPQLLGTLLQAMEHDRTLAAAACHILAFAEDEDIDAETFVFRYSPTGGPLLGGLLQDVYGDTSALFQADVLRSVDGFELERWSPNEDWETFVKLSVRGHRVDVVPRALYYYRTDSGGRLQELDDAGTTFRQRHRMVDSFYADAPLTRRERIELLESFLSFDWLAHFGLNDQAQWYQAELDKAAAWHESEMEGLREWMQEQIDAERQRAEQQLLASQDGVGASGASAPPRLSTRALVRELGERGGERLRWYSDKSAQVVRARRSQLRGTVACARSTRRTRNGHVQPSVELRQLLSQRAAQVDDFFFVQIGAFDGRTADPLYEFVAAHRWHGVLVEPQPRYFHNLQTTYAGFEGLVLRKVAIAERAGPCTMYVIDPGPGVPPWAGQLASLDRETILKHREFLPEIESLIRPQEVECVTIDQLLAEAPSDHFDLLLVDAEGYDYEILSHLDIARFKPAIVQFENAHMPKSEHEELADRFGEFGYLISAAELDTIAYLPDDSG